VTCIDPPELDEVDLLMFLDGEADDEVVRHLKLCPHCREKVERLAAMEDRIATLLYRVTCPSPEALRDYHFDLLSRAEAVDVRAHLAKCPHCTRELVTLHDYLAVAPRPAEPSTLERVTERIRVLVAQLVQPGAGGLAPAFAVRGDEEATLIYEVEEARIVLDVMDDPQRADQKILEGTVIGLDVADLQAHLWQDDQLIGAVPVDDTGSFVIPGVPRGVYELILSRPATVVRIGTVRVGGNDPPS
jgi:anti-sigma factor RsiW